MDKEKRVAYQKEYRNKYGDKMRLQIKEWFSEHNNYLKKWRVEHPSY